MARQRLSNVKLDEVSFVGKGDNPEAHIVLLKMKPGEKYEAHRIVKMGKGYAGRDKDRILKEWMDTHPDRLTLLKEGDAMTFDAIIANREIKDKIWTMIWILEDSISSIMCDSEVTDKASMIQQSVDEFKAAITPITKKEGGDEMSVELKKQLEEAEKKTAEITKERDDLKAENETLKAACSDKDKKMKDMEEKVAKDSDEDPIYKGLPEPVVKEMKDNRARIAKMEDDNLERQYVEKATPLILIGKAEDTGAMLKKIAKSDPTLAAEVLAVLTTANARIAEGDLLKEKGKTAASGSAGSAVEKLNDLAKAHREKNSGMTIEKAFTEVYDDPANSDLRKQYNEEMRSRA